MTGISNKQKEDAFRFDVREVTSFGRDMSVIFLHDGPGSWRLRLDQPDMSSRPVTA